MMHTRKLRITSDLTKLSRTLVNTEVNTWPVRVSCLVTYHSCWPLASHMQLFVVYRNLFVVYRNLLFVIHTLCCIAWKLHVCMYWMSFLLCIGNEFIAYWKIFCFVFCEILLCIEIRFRESTFCDVYRIIYLWIEIFVCVKIFSFVYCTYRPP